MPVHSLHFEYEQRQAQWARIRDAYEGSDAVKAAGVHYLPALDHDQMLTHKGQHDYEDYKTRALWWNATSRTVDGLAGTVFQKPVSVEGVSDAVAEQLKNVTLSEQSSSLNDFALGSFRERLTTNRYGILVDLPEEGSKRPRWLLYRAEDVINWHWTQDRLDLVVVLETADDEEEADEFSTPQRPQIRVFSLDEDGIYTQRRYRLKDDDEAARPTHHRRKGEVHHEGQHGGHGEAHQLSGQSEADHQAHHRRHGEAHHGVGHAGGRIAPEDDWEEVGEPVIPRRRNEPLSFLPFELLPVSKPPLLDMVDVNYSWYRSSADREHALFWVSCPTPWVSGVEVEGPLTIGSRVALQLGDAGSAGMLEHSGAGIGAIKEAQDEKRALMATLGARLLEDQPSEAETATAVMLRHAGEFATIRTLAQRESESLTRVLQIHAWWVGTEEAPEDVEATVKLNDDLEGIRATPEEVAVALEALQAGKISHATFYHKLQRGPWTRPGIDAETELNDIANDPDTIRGEGGT